MFVPVVMKCAVDIDPPSRTMRTVESVMKNMERSRWMEESKHASIGGTTLSGHIAQVYLRYRARLSTSLLSLSLSRSIHTHTRFGATSTCTLCGTGSFKKLHRAKQTDSKH